MTNEKKAPTSLAETMIRRSINQSSLAKAVGAVAMDAFAVNAPSTEGLSFNPPDMVEVTKEEVQERYEGLRRQSASRQRVTPGDVVEMGDDVLVNIIPYSGGRIVPFLARWKAQIVLGADEVVDGLDAELADLPVGFSGNVELVLPEDFLHPEFAGKRAVLAVRILDANRPVIAENDEDEVLRRLNRGARLSEVFETITGEIEREKASTAHLLAARECVEQLGRRVAESVTDSMVEQEMTKRWFDGEGKILELLGVSSLDRVEALKTYVSNRPLREETKKNIASSAAVLSVAKRDKLILDQATLEAIWADWATQYGSSTTLEELTQMVKSGDKTATNILYNLSYLYMVDHVTSLASADVQT